MNWLTLQWMLMRHHLLEPDDTILAAGDHVVVTKAGKKTYGLDRLFSSLSGKAVPGPCFLSLSLISAKRRTSYPAFTEQVAKAPVVQKQPKQTCPGQRGRPQGRKNRNRREVDFSPSLRFIRVPPATLLDISQIIRYTGSPVEVERVSCVVERMGRARDEATRRGQTEPGRRRGLDRAART
jgi:hypothetical protein